MFQDSLDPRASYLTVGQITAHLRSMLLQDDILQDIWIRGEASGASLSRGGHLFFSLKDRDALIKAVAWAPLSRRLFPKLADGQEVLAHGRVDLYPQQGVYQLYVDEIMPVGTGVAYLEYERVRAMLQEEGLFADERKRPLPPYPRRVGVVTSAFGAARRDIENVLGQRWPAVEMVLANAMVQGEGAPETIVTALEAVAAQGVDVIILGRGGGDQEALACFNDERVARAIAAMPVPVVTGIGHETDFTISDFVADLRAPTPSAAAMAVVPDRQEVGAAISRMRDRLQQVSLEAVADRRLSLAQQGRLLMRSSPSHTVRTWQLALEDASTRLLREAGRLAPARRSELLGAGMHLRSTAPRPGPWRDRLALVSGSLKQVSQIALAASRGAVAGVGARLAPLDPEATLRRGYSIVHRGSFDGPVLTDAAATGPGEGLAIRLSRGEATATVTGTASDRQERRDSD